MPKGGPQPGSGRKKGFRFKSTMLKEAAREAVRQRITERLNELIDAQMDNAIGINHLLFRDPSTGRFERVEGTVDQIDAKLKMGTGFQIYTKDPNVTAFTDLLNRALDKPAEHVEVTGNADKPLVIKWKTEAQ